MVAVSIKDGEVGIVSRFSYTELKSLLPDLWWNRKIGHMLTFCLPFSCFSGCVIWLQDVGKHSLANWASVT